jgi:redox-sensitive bicupin YhaK (pirin superfamily)
VASGEERQGLLKISQDANIYAARLVNSEKIVFTNSADRQGYLVCLEGRLTANETELCPHDALKIWGEEILNLSAQEDSHFLLIEMAADE